MKLQEYRSQFQENISKDVQDSIEDYTRTINNIINTLSKLKIVEDPHSDKELIDLLNKADQLRYNLSAITLKIKTLLIKKYNIR